MLNIEQYEYMRSQKEVAGAYGLVADQDEASASMAGLGFSISKGTYTSVALSKTSVSKLIYIDAKFYVLLIMRKSL